MRLWQSACAHTAIRLSLDREPHPAATIGPDDVLPFGTRVLARGARNPSDHFEDRFRDAIFLHPSLRTPEAAEVWAIAPGEKPGTFQLAGQFTATTVRAFDDSDATFPAVHAVPTAEEKRWVDQGDFRCHGCGKRRLVKQHDLRT